MKYKDVFAWSYIRNYKEFQKKYVNIKLNSWWMFNILNKGNIE